MMAGKFKHLSMHITVKVPKWLSPVHARREIRTLVNEQTFWGQRKPGSFEGIDRDCLRLVSCEAAPKHPDQMFVVTAEHFAQAGIPRSIHQTLEGAQARALELTNKLRDWVGLEACIDPKGWKVAMEQARAAQAETLDMHIDDLNGDDGDGWVEMVETKVEY